MIYAVETEKDGAVSMGDDAWVTCTASAITERRLVDASDTSAHTISEEYSGGFYDATSSVSGSARWWRPPRDVRPGKGLISASAGQLEAAHTTEVARVLSLIHI